MSEVCSAHEGSRTPIQRRHARSWRLALAAILLVGLSYATLIQSFSWNQTSHYDLIRTLNDDGTTIDKYQSNTGDKAEYHGHYYSARAPGLALFALPFYDGLKLIGAESWTDAHVAPPNHPGDEMIYLIGLWANVLPGLLLLVLVWRVAERFEPGYGAAAAVALGLGTMVLPLSTLLFSHVFTTFLAFGAFWIMLREREGPPSPMLLGVAGLAMGYAFSSEYPTFFAALVLGGYLLSRRDARTPALIVRRGGAYVLGGLIGIVPLLLYNHYAFGSWTHLAYSSIPRQQTGLLRHRPAQPEGAGDAAAGLARAVDDLPGADPWRAGHGAAVQAWQPGRGADDHGHLHLLSRLQLGLLPAVRRRLHGPAVPRYDAAVPGVPGRRWRSSAGRVRRSRWRAPRSR